MIKRSYLEVLKTRLGEEPRRFIQVLYGPRQVGKTTIVTQLIKELPFASLFVTADNVPAANDYWIKESWDNARRQMQLSGAPEFLLVIDEIQKINNWSEVVKKEWDKDSFTGLNLKVIILGSSRLLIQQGLTESLAGRFETIYVTHWTYAEMQQAFGWTVDQYIAYGGYPGAAPLVADEQRWRNYVNDSLIETSISKDILMLSKVEKPALLRRLFEIGSAYSAQIVSLNKIQGELQENGNLTTLSNYLKLLEGAGLLTGLEKYSGNMIRKRSSKPKFQVFNNALMTVKVGHPLELIKQLPQMWGRWVESAVGLHLLNASIREHFNLYYWNESNNEVDFVMEKNGELIAVEVKSGKDSANKGIALFSEAYKPKHVFTVGTDGIPLEDFLLSSPVRLFEI